MPTEDLNTQQNTSKKTINKKVLVLFVIVIFVAIAFALWYMANPKDSDSGKINIVPKGDSSETSDLKTDSDLKKLEDEVKNTNIDDLNKDLEGNDADSSEF